MMQLEQANGVVVMPITRKGALLAFPNRRENGGKEERTAIMTNFEKVSGRQLLGGAIELQKGETEEGAAIREAWEEGWVRLNHNQLTKAPFGLPVEQKSRGYFGVEVYEARLTFFQELWLKYVRGAREVRLDQSMNDFRVRDRAVIQLARESGLI